MGKYHIPIIVIVTVIAAFLFIEGFFTVVGLFGAINQGLGVVISIFLFSALFAYCVIIEKRKLCWISGIVFGFLVIISSVFAIPLIIGGIIAIILTILTRKEEREQSTRVFLAITGSILLLIPSYFIIAIFYDPIDVYFYNTKVKEYINENYSNRNYEVVYSHYYWYDSYHTWNVYDKDSEYDVYFRIIVSKRDEKITDYEKWETGGIKYSVPSSCFYDTIEN